MPPHIHPRCTSSANEIILPESHLVFAELSQQGGPVDSQCSGSQMNISPVVFHRLGKNFFPKESTAPL
jgi:hypothetical protein